MSIIIDGNAGISFNDSTSQNTSAVVSGKLPVAKLLKFIVIVDYLLSCSGTNVSYTGCFPITTTAWSNCTC